MLDLQQALGVAGKSHPELLDAKARAVEILDHDVAFLAGNADHRMAEGQRHFEVEALRRCLQRLDIDGFRVDQQTVHVEKGGLNRFSQHAFVLSSILGRARRRKIHAHP